MPRRSASKSANSSYQRWAVAYESRSTASAMATDSTSGCPAAGGRTGSVARVYAASRRRFDPVKSRADGLHRDHLRPTFGKELTEGIVEQEVGPVRRLLAGLGIDAPAGHGQSVHRVRQISRTGHERVGQRTPQRARRATGPEEEPDHDAHAATDSDVLNTSQSHLPAGGLDDVEQDDDHRGEGGLTGSEGDHRRRDARDEHCDREQRPEESRMVRHTDHDERADKEAHRRPADGTEGGGAGAQRIGPQHRQGPQNHPEAVLDVGELDHQHGNGQARRSPQRIAEPHRAEGEMGEEPVRIDARGGPVGHPHPPVDDGFRSSRLERGVGDHLGGDAEGAGMEPRVELARQALVLVRLPVGGTGCCFPGVRRHRGQ